MTSIVLTGGTVVDGTGRPSYTADVALSGGQVAEIGKLSTANASDVIDADGLVIAPGFVDPHVHYDAQVMWDPALTPSSMYGVTTVIGGNCGFGVAPLGKRNAHYMLRLLANVEGMSIKALEVGSDWSWDSFDEWLDRIADHLAVNAAFFIGLSSGLSWLAWAVGTPVVMISGFTHPTNEFATPYRVINEQACNSCWNDPRHRFDHKDFFYGPRHRGTPRQFECTRLITAERVMAAVRRIPGFGVHGRARAGAWARRTPQQR